MKPTLARLAHWPLRLALGSVFIYHGFSKFGSLEGLSEMMGMPVFAIAMLAAMEALAGLLVLAGGFGADWMTRLGGLLVIPIMLGAIFMVHLQHGWNSVNMGSGNMGQGMEFQFTLLMIALYFVFAGNRQPDSDVHTASHHVAGERLHMDPVEPRTPAELSVA